MELLYKNVLSFQFLNDVMFLDSSGFESKWRPKCKEEEIKTPQLYERNRQLRLELQMLYRQADTVITHAQGTD